MHNRPVMLALMYYNCQMLCPQVLHGMASALRESGFHAGNEYDVVVASIDPADKPADAVIREAAFSVDARRLQRNRRRIPFTFSPGRSPPSPISPRRPASTTFASRVRTERWISSRIPA